MEKRNSLSGITFTPEEKKKFLDEIIYYFETERDEKLGIIASENILDFFIDNLGKSIYNKALNDAKVWYAKRSDELESDYYTLYKEER